MARNGFTISEVCRLNKPRSIQRTDPLIFLPMIMVRIRRRILAMYSKFEILKKVLVSSRDKRKTIMIPAITKAIWV